MKTLQDLFIDQLQDAYSAETQLVKALPKMARAAHSAELKEGFRMHLEETKEQVLRLKEVCKMLKCKPNGQTCEAMQGLIIEGEEIIALDAEASARDAGLIAAAQKVEHYEIALYGTLCAWATELDLEDAAHILYRTLEEERRTDEKLTELAEGRVNAQAHR